MALNSKILNKLTELQIFEEPLVWEILDYDSLDSTNNEAFRLYEERGNDFLPNIIVAKSQTGGRGQFDRSWSSPEGNLYCSLSFSKSFYEWKIEQRIDESKLTLRVGKLIHEMILGLNLKDSSKLKVKEPNDILYDGLKLAGILIEVKGDLVVIGIGINTEIAPIEGSISIKELILSN